MHRTLMFRPVPYLPIAKDRGYNDIERE